MAALAGSPSDQIPTQRPVYSRPKQGFHGNPQCFRSPPTGTWLLPIWSPQKVEGARVVSASVCLVKLGLQTDAVKASLAWQIFLLVFEGQIVGIHTCRGFPWYLECVLGWASWGPTPPISSQLAKPERIGVWARPHSGIRMSLLSPSYSDNHMTVWYNQKYNCYFH